MLEPTPAEIRAFRADRSWSQKEFGDRVKATVRTVQDWEGGRRQPPEMLGLMLHFIRRHESLATQLQMLESGGMKVHVDHRDVTQESIDSARAMMSEYAKLIGRDALE